MELSYPLRSLHKLPGVCRIKSEHLVVAGDDSACANGFTEFRGLAGIQVPGDPALWCAAVDGEQCNVDRKLLQPLHHSVVKKRVAAVINGPRPKLHNVAQIFRAHFFMCSGNSRHLKLARRR